MARHGLSRPSQPADDIPRRPPIPHDRWQPSHLTGSLFLAFETPKDQFVSPATGRLTLTQSEGQEVVAQEAARRAGVPVLPGSGIKGAVRAAFELLSFSCDPFAAVDRARRRDGGEICTRRSCCEACSLFGVLGWTGRVSFKDAAPAEPGSVEIQVRKVPIPWQPDGSKTGGDFRLYDLEESRMLDPGRRTWIKRPKELVRETFTGRFMTTMTFVNVTPAELGRLLLCLGLAPDLSTHFFLRLGGVKYDGKGAVIVTPLELRLAAPRREELKTEACKARCGEWIAMAQASDWASTFWAALEELADALQTTD